MQMVNIILLFLFYLTPSRRVYYIFSGPPYGIIFSENSGKTLKKRNACSDVRRSAVQNKIAGLNGLRSERVNKLKCPILCQL